MSHSCVICGKRSYSAYCVLHKPRKPINRLRRPRKMSDKEVQYQVWKETVARPALIARDGNKCTCCNRPAEAGEKLDIEHTITKGSRPELKQELSNLTLMDRFCHHYKTIGQKCPHRLE